MMLGVRCIVCSRIRARVLGPRATLGVLAFVHSALDRDRRTAKVVEVLFVDEGFVALVEGVHVDTGVHSDGIAGAGFNAESTDNAAQFVDDKGNGVLLDARVVVLTCFDVNAVRGAGCRAQHARDTTHLIVLPIHQAV